MKILKDEYHDYILYNVNTTKNKQILFELLHDFTGRRGLRQEWEQIDQDIQKEILEEWLSIISKKREE